jgi:hypothetical protein
MMICADAVLLHVMCVLLFVLLPGGGRPVSGLPGSNLVMMHTSVGAALRVCDTVFLVDRPDCRQPGLPLHMPDWMSMLCAIYVFLIEAHNLGVLVLIGNVKGCWEGMREQLGSCWRFAYQCTETGTFVLPLAHQWTSVCRHCRWSVFRPPVLYERCGHIAAV